jgi:8-oxo-dGTP pyrophosphatase MutT (NUDIX family)
METIPMTRDDLKAMLAAHVCADATEVAAVSTILRLLEDPDAYRRERLAGHVTASAVVVDPARTNVLLIHHRKLDLWLQPGGHADGEENLWMVAANEVMEETGLTRVDLVSRAPLDVDVHSIPAWGSVPAHLHHDVAFLFEADPAQPMAPAEREVKGVRWFEEREIGKDLRMMRMAAKALRKLTPAGVPWAA